MGKVRREYERVIYLARRNFLQKYWSCIHPWGIDVRIRWCKVKKQGARGSKYDFVIWKFGPDWVKQRDKEKIEGAWRGSQDSQEW